MTKDTFDRLAAELAAATALTELEARGTLRLVLKTAGLDARTATAGSLRIVVERGLARELAARGIADADGVCARLARALPALAADDGAARGPDPASAGSSASVP